MENKDFHSKHVKKLMEQWIAENPYHEKYYESKAILLWKTLAGEEATQAVTGIYISHKILYIKVHQAALRSDWHYRLSEWVVLINTEIGFEVIEKIVLC